jgi:hypothetical protein
MAVTLKWNTPGVRWSSGLQWNGTAPTPTKMPKIQIALKLKLLSDPQKAAKGNEIAGGLTSDAAG